MGARPPRPRWPLPRRRRGQQLELPRRRPGRRPRPDRPRARQPHRRRRALDWPRRRRDAGPDGLGAVALLVAARPPRPRPALRRDRPAPQRRPARRGARPGRAGRRHDGLRDGRRRRGRRAGGSAPTSTRGDDPAILANAVAGEGLVALVAGDLATARDRFEEAGGHAERGRPRGRVDLGRWPTSGSAPSPCSRATPTRRCGSIEAGLDSARRREDRLTSYIALYNLFQVELGRGDHDAARGHLEESTRLSLETGDQANLAYLLDAGAVLGRRLRPARAGAAAAGCRAGDPRGARRPRLRLLPARPRRDPRGRRRRPRPPRRRPLRRRRSTPAAGSRATDAAADLGEVRDG